MSFRLVTTVIVAPLSLTCRMFMRTWSRFSSSNTTKMPKNDKNLKLILTSGFLYFVKHRKWSVSKLSTWVRLCVNAWDLVKLICDKLVDHLSCALGEQEDVPLILQKVRHCFVLCDICWLKRLFSSQTKVPNILDNLFPSVYQILTFVD